MRASFLAPVVLSLVACGATPSPAHPEGQGPAAGAACPGKIEAADGLEETQDDVLLQQALGKAGEGKLCTGKVYAATRPVTVYRVWNKAKAYTQLGGWWSLAKPLGPVDRYRHENVICPEWSELNVVSSCTIKVGAKVVVGPGQSARCQDGTWDASPVNQIFIPNATKDPANQKVYVEGCTQGAPWP
jgi:hypothetical protein